LQFYLTGLLKLHQVHNIGCFELSVIAAAAFTRQMPILLSNQNHQNTQW